MAPRLSTRRRGIGDNGAVVLCHRLFGTAGRVEEPDEQDETGDGTECYAYDLAGGGRVGESGVGCGDCDGAADGDDGVVGVLAAVEAVVGVGEFVKIWDEGGYGADV